MKKKVLLDIDGVLADFYKGLAEYLNKNIHAELPLDKEPSAYSFYKWNDKIPASLMDKEVPKWVISGGYRSMPIFPGAVQFVEELRKNNEVFIVTARLGDFATKLSEPVLDIIKKDTLNWFNQHGISPEKLFFNHDKVDFCQKNGINIMIEDKLPTVIEAAQKGISSILVNRGWNQNGEIWDGKPLSRDHQGIMVANSYQDILDYLKGLNGER